jgi:cytochrome c5
MRLAAALALALLCGCAAVRDESTAVAAAPTPAAAAPNPWSEPARKVLIEHCGGCHLGTLRTANPRALKIYDLSETVWDARLKPENFPGITRRVERQASDEQKAVVDKYIRCARDRACGPG